MDRIQKLAAGSIAVGLIVLGLKFAAYQLTGSIALYSDALESIINVVTAATALIAVRTSAKPADANHPYGHHKAEYFSAVLEGVLIVIAALSIFRAAYFGYVQRIGQPAERGLVLGPDPPGPAQSITGPGSGRAASPDGRAVVGRRAPWRHAGGHHGLGSPGSGACGTRGHEYSVVGLAGREGVRWRPYGRGGTRINAGPDSGGDLV
jgi:Cation efflux family